MNGEILERISSSGKILISDLRASGRKRSAAHHLKGINWRDYSLEECSYSLSYIFGRKLAFSNYEEVQAFVDRSVRDEPE